jgi:hypothetical protein
MSMEWDHVSELRPSSGLLFIPQVIYEYGATVECYWQTSLAIVPAQSSSSKAGGTWRRKRFILPSKHFCSYLKVILTCRKILHGADGFPSPLKEVVQRIFIALSYLLDCWIGGWLGLRAGLVTEAREKVLCLCRGSNPGGPVCNQRLLTEQHLLIYSLFSDAFSITQTI